MRELHPGVLVEIFFQGCPELFVVPDFFAHHAGWEEVLQLGNVSDVFDHHQGQLLTTVFHWACGDQDLQILLGQFGRKLEIHDLTANDLSFQALCHRIANDTLTADWSPAASLNHIGGMQAMQDFAAPAFIHSLTGLTTELGRRNVQFQYLHVVINHERRDRYRVEYRPVKRVMRLPWQVGISRFGVLQPCQILHGFAIHSCPE